MGPAATLPVLVIDDEDVIRDLLRDVFEMAGIPVVVTQDGTAALEALQDMAFSVVFCDLRMPGISGAKLVQEIHARVPDLGIVMMSGDDEGNGDLQAALAAGANTVLQKPFRFKDVIAIYEELLSPV